ncbi:uncharacterized protein LOC127703070 [Mytilus californianus]|uniref:uncharacterized protein LOC127703070 n=1 Tax=Mytilus californianus TaxID=6549 RepID=UPI002245909D|nr:uncharacterized protein LOC127703070 [Mytilus californianus]
MKLCSFFLFFGTVISVEDIQDQLTSGLCLCIDANYVYARSDPGGDNPAVGVLKKGACLKSHGGILHKKGVTWYEVHMATGQNVWINGNNLIAVNMTECMNPSTTVTPVKSSSDRIPTASVQTTTDFDPFAGALDFCITGDGSLIGSGDTTIQNGMTCTCTSGQIICPTLFK